MTNTAGLEHWEHSQDSDCTVLDGECIFCHVEHGDPCVSCGGSGFHKTDCPSFDPEDRRVFDCQRFGAPRGKEASE